MRDAYDWFVLSSSVRLLVVSARQVFALSGGVLTGTYSF